jgi:glucosylceramidase
VKERFPNKHLTFSEGCIEYSRFDTNQIRNAQMYGHDMIGNFAAGMDSFIDWNICLDEQGGPNYVGNYCEAPIICDTENGALSYKLSFHYISHFSRFIKPGAKRIATTIYTDEIEQVAFLNPDGSIVVVIQNRSAVDKNVSLRMADKLIDVELPAESISSIVVL